ncbi:unnamed protein product, partial [Fusarium graminearum]
GGGNDGDACTIDSDCTSTGSICLDDNTCGPDPDNTGTDCNTAADCTANAGLCLSPLGINLCLCVNSLCVAGPGGGNDGDACTIDSDCTATGSICLDDNTCGPDPNDGGTNSCNAASDCTANAALCLSPLGINICLCVNSVCIVSGGGGNDGDACSVDADCTTAGSECNNSVCGPPTSGGSNSCNAASDCTANAGLCLSPLGINLCLCVNSVCIVSGGGGSGGNNGDACTANSDCTTAGSQCINNVCGPPASGGGSNSCTRASDCTANAGLCLSPLGINLCLCVNSICIR